MGSNASRFEVVNGSTFFQRLEAIKGRCHRPFKPSTTLSKKQLLSGREDMKISVSSRPSDGTLPYSLEDIITNTPKGTPPQEIKIETKGNVGIAIIIAANEYGVMKVVAEEKPIVVNDHAKKESHNVKEVTFIGINGDDDVVVDDDDDDNDNDERRIGYDDGEAFPGSPSFRVYFEENREHNHNDETVRYGDGIPEIVSTGDIIPPKEVTSHVEKKVKRGGKKRCFRKVLPKKGSQADVKRLLNMKSCYS